MELSVLQRVGTREVPHHLLRDEVGQNWGEGKRVVICTDESIKNAWDDPIFALERVFEFTNENYIYSVQLCKHTRNYSLFVVNSRYKCFILLEYIYKVYVLKYCKALT